MASVGLPGGVTGREGFSSCWGWGGVRTCCPGTVASGLGAGSVGLGISAAGGSGGCEGYIGARGGGVSSNSPNSMGFSVFAQHLKAAVIQVIISI